MGTFSEELDVQLRSFCRDHGLHLSISYQCVDVRSIQIVDDQSRSYQLWLEETESGWSIRAWDYQSRHCEHATQARNIRSALEAAYEDVQSWIEEIGHTRTIA